MTELHDWFWFSAPSLFELRSTTGDTRCLSLSSHCDGRMQRELMETDIGELALLCTVITFSKVGYTQTTTHRHPSVQQIVLSQGGKLCRFPVRSTTLIGDSKVKEATPTRIEKERFAMSNLRKGRVGQFAAQELLYIVSE
jgi:hypothetical protein